MDPLPSLLKMSSSLMVVLAIIALAAYLARRYFGTTLGRWRSQHLIQVVARTPVGPKREIALIEIGQEYLVVGITASQISLLTRLEGTPFSSSVPGEIGRGARP